MNKAYVLFEVCKYEGAHMVALYSTSKAAWKSGLELKRNRVAEALDFYRMTGEPAAEFWYRHCWDSTYLAVELEEINNDTP